jgi:multidrug efflux system outer membrane protein
VQQSFADVENALSARLRLAEQLAAQGRLVAALSDYSRLARLQFTGGYAPYFAVVQAEQQLFPQELRYTTSQAAQLVAVANLYKALGGGWIEQAESLAVAPAAAAPVGASAPAAAAARP